MGGATKKSVRGNYRSFNGINLTVLEGMHSSSLSCIYLVSRTTSERRGRSVRGGRWVGGDRGGREGGGAKKGFLTALGRIDVARGLLYAWCKV